MSGRDFNPLRLDVEAFAEAGAELAGAWSLADLPRLAATTSAEAPPRPEDRVDWSARGLCHRRTGVPPELRIELRGSAVLRLECQRCLLPVETPITLDRPPVRFVAGEAQAAALDADSDEDVLALSRSFDLRELIEDELLLALPLVPRHETCPVALPAAEPAAADEAPERPHPFAALAALKKPGPTH